MRHVDEGRERTALPYGPSDPAGDLLRRYWQPVAPAEEIEPGSAPLPVRILSEDLTLFRDQYNRLGLVARHCAHRAADLSYARIEDGGLRCLYHGWLYDIHGNCLEQPGEPEGSTFKDKIQLLSYPVTERACVVFAYLGPGEPPLLPAYEFLDIAPEHRVTGAHTAASAGLLPPPACKQRPWELHLGRALLRVNAPAVMQRMLESASGAGPLPMPIFAGYRTK